MSAVDAQSRTLVLSRLSLNLRSRDVRADLANSQALHRRLLDAFPQTSREGNGLLYRVDPAGGSLLNGATLLVQSQIIPDWTCLPEGYIAGDPYAFGLEGEIPVKEIAAGYDRIGEGDIFRFRLRASPTKRIPWNVWAKEHPAEARKIEGSSRKLMGPRVPVTLLTEEEKCREHPPSAEDKLRGWIVRKGEQHGFRVADLTIRPDPLTGDMQRGRKSGDDGSPLDLAHKAIVFEGVLKVTDADAVRSALWNGIGSGKAYGFGLLSLARIGGA